MSEFQHGLMIGKFYPPHLGHHRAIRDAAARCQVLTVLVMAAAVETIELSDRVAWLREEHQADFNVRIAGIRCDAPVDVTDDAAWSTQVASMTAGLAFAGARANVDAVFSGDDYGTELARRFDAVGVRIERGAETSTAVRRDLVGTWQDLAAATRAGLTTRVVVVGAESTGTSTVAAELTRHYAARGDLWADTRCVAEYGREYTEIKWSRDRSVPLTELCWYSSDFDAVGVEQTRREEAAARAGSPLLICDTDAFATTIWKRRYLNQESQTPEPWSVVPPRAVYLITDHHDVPWHDDGLREGDLAVRAAMTSWFIESLTRAGHSWVLLTGTLQRRVDLAVRTIDPLLELRARFDEPLHGPGFEGRREG